MSDRQNIGDESWDLAEQLEEWARLNDGVSFGDPTTVALCRAAAAMLRADEETRAEQSGQTEAEAQSVARAILAQRARLEAMPAPPEDDFEPTAPSPIPLTRRNALTVGDDAVDESESTEAESAEEDSALYEDAEDEDEKEAAYDVAEADADELDDFEDGEEEFAVAALPPAPPPPTPPPPAPRPAAGGPPAGIARKPAPNAESAAAPPSIARKTPVAPPVAPPVTPHVEAATAAPPSIARKAPPAPQVEPPPPEDEPLMDDAALEAAEELDPEDDFEPVQETEDVIPWYALPEDDEETAEPAAPNLSAQAETAEEIEWDESDWADDDEKDPVPDAMQNAAPETSASGDHEPFDLSLVPEHGAQAQNTHAFDDSDEVGPYEGGPDEGEIDADEPGALLAVPHAAGPNFDHAATDFAPDPTRIKPSLQDEIARLVALLDNAAEEPEIEQKAVQTAYDTWDEADTGEAADIYHSASAPAMNDRRMGERRMAHAASAPGPGHANRAAVLPPTIYRKPVHEELQVCIDRLRFFAAGR